jgi:hypothetical protein
MSKKAMYMAKIDKKDFAEWKSKKGKFNGRLMFQLWIEFLCIPKNFLNFFGNVDKAETERTKEDITKYKIVELDQENWDKFMVLCKDNDMYANDAINILVKRFNAQGYCIETKLKV